MEENINIETNLGKEQIIINEKNEIRKSPISIGIKPKRMLNEVPGRPCPIPVTFFPLVFLLYPFDTPISLIQLSSIYTSCRPESVEGDIKCMMTYEKFNYPLSQYERHSKYAALYEGLLFSDLLKHHLSFPITTRIKTGNLKFDINKLKY
ncbi:hypothetical protein H8356DRAFT_1416666 [Neocallimastix lanati (nom. inval.)]|nr:hypothetical protein H8356DRAFT_1416666 [Neocallimastix sp. JGI-2020a]